MSVEKIIATLKEQAAERNRDESADELERFIRAMLKEYTAVLGFSEDEILSTLEGSRDYSAVNYYQAANFPSLKDVDVYDTTEQLRDRFPSGEFVCPNCKGISTHPTTCNSGLIMANDLPCDWKAWGMFRTFGKGYRFVVKAEFLNNPVVHEIFMPLELHNHEI